ncbi:MAG: FMN-binding protein, partial [Sphingomonas sp.]|nr:FMN-binding protein [Sphingomonas sp.]
MGSASPWYVVVPAALVSVAGPAHATQYLTIAQAQRLLFPSATAFVDRTLALTPTQRKAIGRAAEIAPGNSQ